MDRIAIRGAREHNLKNLTLSIPRDRLTVITGVSGSGKSSLAFDTLYAEGQRRYVESLSAYARQFLGQMEKPDVDQIEGLSPAISIEQRTAGHNPRSTVATTTEIYDYLRVLFARAGVQHCHQCGRAISRQSIDQILAKVMEGMPGRRIQILAPVVSGRKGEYKKDLDGLRRQGFLRVRVDGELKSLEEEIVLAKNRRHTLELVVDRVPVEEGRRRRIADSLETALSAGKGTAIVLDESGGEEVFSEESACPKCGISFEPLHPRNFSFNSPYGACTVLPGTREPHGDRSRSPRDRAGSVDRERRPARLPPGRVGVDRKHPAIAGEAVRLLSRHPLEEAHEEGPRARPARNGQGRGPGRPQDREGRVSLEELVRRGDRKPDATLPRDAVARDPGVDRGVHEPPSLPGLRRRPAQAADPGGPPRTQEHRRSHGPLCPRRPAGRSRIS